MYQGNHDSRDKRNSSRESGTPRRFRWRKEFVLLVSVFAMIAGVVGGTVAYLVAGTDPLINNFDLAEVSCSVEEYFNGKIKKDVKIQNTGDIPAYIRAKVVVTWKDEDGNVYGQAPIEETDYSIQYNETDWKQDGDYWYYDEPVAPVTENNCCTPVLIHSCSPIADQTPEGYNLSVEILAEAIQSEPHNESLSAIKDAWNHDPTASSNQ